MVRLSESKENWFPISCVSSVASVTLRDAERPSVSIIATSVAMVRLSESKENWFIFAKREHHRHFSGKDTNYRAQCKIYHDLFLTKEEGVRLEGTVAGCPNWLSLNTA